MVLVSTRRIGFWLLVAPKSARRLRARPERRPAAARRPGRARSACVRVPCWRRRRSPRPARASASRPRRPRRPSARLNSSIWELRGWRTRRTWAGCSTCPPIRRSGTTTARRTTRRCAALAAGHRCAAPRRARPWPMLRGPCPRSGRTSRPSEALLTVRILDDSVEREVRADHDRCHFDAPFIDWCVPRSSRRLPRRKLSGEFRAAPTSVPVMSVKGDVAAMMRT
jgi:hypothetical protein